MSDSGRTIRPYCDYCGLYHEDETRADVVACRDRTQAKATLAERERWEAAVRPLLPWIQRLAETYFDDTIAAWEQGEYGGVFAMPDTPTVGQLRALAALLTAPA